MSNTITIKAELADSDRKLLSDVLAALGKASGKAAPAKPAKPAKATEPEADADFDDGMGGDATDGEDGGDATDGEDGGEFEGAGDEGETEKAPERADVHKAMKAYSVAAGSAAEAVKLMAKHGGTDKLSALKPEKFAVVIKAMEAATKKASKK